MSNTQDPNFGQAPAPEQPAPQQPQYVAPQQPAPQQPQYAAPQQPPAQQPSYAAPQQYAPAPATKPTNTMAIISMISSIIGWFSFGILCIVGVILGHISMKQIKRTGEGGRGMALAGLIVGYIGIAGWIIGLIIFIIFMSVLGASLAASGTSY